MRGLSVGLALLGVGLTLGACSGAEAEKPTYVVQAHVDSSVTLSPEVQSAIGEVMKGLSPEETSQLEELIEIHQSAQILKLQEPLLQKFKDGGVSQEEMHSWLEEKARLHELRGEQVGCSPKAAKVRGLTCEIDDPYDLVEPFLPVPKG